MDASADKTDKSTAGRAAYRKRISRPAMRRVTEAEAQRPGDMVDEMARAFERALQERRRNQEHGLTATEAELPIEDDETPSEETEPRPATRKKKRKTPRVFRFTPPPIARDILFGTERTPAQRASAITEPAVPSDPPPADLEFVNPPSEPPEEVPYGQPRVHRPSSRPPRPTNARSSLPPASTPPDAHVASRKAWLDFADEPLDSLVPARSKSVIALEWLLGEDALGAP